MGGTPPERVVLSCIRKQAEQAKCSSTASVSIPVSRFLPGAPALDSLCDGL